MKIFSLIRRFLQLPDPLPEVIQNLSKVSTERAVFLAFYEKGLDLRSIDKLYVMMAGLYDQEVLQDLHKAIREWKDISGWLLAPYDVKGDNMLLVFIEGVEEAPDYIAAVRDPFELFEDPSVDFLIRLEGPCHYNTASYNLIYPKPGPVGRV